MSDLFMCVHEGSIVLCMWDRGGIITSASCLVFGLEILSLIKAPPQVAFCWFDEGCQTWREWAWYSKKDHYITSLLHYCAFLLWELGLCFFFTPLSHTPCYLPSLFSYMLLRSLSFCYTPFTTSAIEPVSAFHTLSCPFVFSQLLHFLFLFL